jgi:hypothetical protein
MAPTNPNSSSGSSSPSGSGSHDEQYYIEQGKHYWQQQDIPRCFAAYDAAINLNPNSPAVQMKAMAMQILDFYYKDRFNP